MDDKQTVRLDISAFSQPHYQSGDFWYDNTLSVVVVFGVLFVALILLSSVFVLAAPFMILWACLVPVFFRHINAIGRAYRHEQLLQFASDNSFALRDEPQYAASGVVFQAGNRDHVTGEILEGTLYDRTVSIYTHSFSTGSGKSQTTHYYGVVEIDLPKAVPSIFIDSKKNNFLGIETLDIFQSQDVIELEGDFNKFFRVFAAKDYQAEVLTLLNPSFMEGLVQHATDYEIELIGSKAYVYVHNVVILSKTSIVQVFEAAEFLIKALDKQLDTFQMNFHDQIPDRIQTSILKRLVDNI